MHGGSHIRRVACRGVNAGGVDAGGQGFGPLLGLGVSGHGQQQVIDLAGGFLAGGVEGRRLGLVKQLGQERSGGARVVLVVRGDRGGGGDLPVGVVPQVRQQDGRGGVGVQGGDVFGDEMFEQGAVREPAILVVGGRCDGVDGSAFVVGETVEVVVGIDRCEGVCPVAEACRGVRVFDGLPCPAGENRQAFLHVRADVPWPVVGPPHPHQAAQKVLVQAPPHSRQRCLRVDGVVGQDAQERQEQRRPAAAPQVPPIIDLGKQGVPPVRPFGEPLFDEPLDILWVLQFLKGHHPHTLRGIPGGSGCPGAGAAGHHHPPPVQLDQPPQLASPVGGGTGLVQRVDDHQHRLTVGGQGALQPVDDRLPTQVRMPATGVETGGHQRLACRGTCLHLVPHVPGGVDRDLHIGHVRPGQQRHQRGLRGAAGVPLGQPGLTRPRNAQHHQHPLTVQRLIGGDQRAFVFGTQLPFQDRRRRLAVQPAQRGVIPVPDPGPQIRHHLHGAGTADQRLDQFLLTSRDLLDTGLAGTDCGQHRTAVRPHLLDQRGVGLLDRPLGDRVLRVTVQIIGMPARV